MQIPSPLLRLLTVFFLAVHGAGCASFPEEAGGAGRAPVGAEAAGTGARPADEVRAAADTLRAYHFRRDFAGGAEAGEALVARYADVVEVQAWLGINLAAAPARRAEALELTAGLLERWAASPWALAARAVVLAYENRGPAVATQPGRAAQEVQAVPAEQAVALAERAFAGAPGDPHMVWVRGSALHAAGRYDDVVALMDSVQPHPWAELLVLKAHALLEAGRPPAAPRGAARVFAEARALDPSNVNAHYLHAAELVNERTMAGISAAQLAEALPLIMRAVSLSPDAASVRELFEHVDRPSERVARLLAREYHRLYSEALQSDSVPPPDLLWIVQGLARHDELNPHTTHSAAPMALAERTGYYREAEALAREGLRLAEDHHARMGRTFETPEVEARAVAALQARMYDALGWIYFQEGRLNEARAELVRAHDLDDSNRSVLYHLGRVAEAEGDMDGAEAMYHRGYSLEVRSGGRTNTEALERIFLTRHGSLAGFDEYMARLAEQDRARRRERVARFRMAEPQPAPAFELELLHGGRYDSRALAGRVAVIEFWSLSCGFCLQKMPEIQQLHEKYRDDPDVVFLTIHSGSESAARVRSWLESQGHDFTILFDGPYGTSFTRDAGVTGWPTTWYVDRDGLIVFTERGRTYTFFEESVWRVELLVGGGKSDSRRGGTEDSPRRVR